MQEEIQPPLQDANFWRQHVEQFQQAKQSKLSYCKQYDLVYHRFLYWVSKLTDSDRSVNTNSTLIPLKLSGKGGKNEAVAILAFSNGIKISIHQEETLAAIIIC